MNSLIKWSMDPSEGPVIPHTTVTFTCKWTFVQRNYGDILLSTPEGLETIFASEQYGAMLKADGMLYIHYVFFYKVHSEGFQISSR
jgi:hypothetical protein